MVFSSTDGRIFKEEQTILFHKQKESFKEEKTFPSTAKAILLARNNSPFTAQ